MKKLTVILLASALAFPAAASARPADHDRSRVTRTVVTTTNAQHNNDRRAQNTRQNTWQNARQNTRVVKKTTVATPRFATGQRFERNRATSYQVVDYRVNQRQLRRPPAGYTWVRSGRDVYLIKQSDRRIARVVANIFR